ncbi:pyridoxal phosphate-dependent aminotransferase [Sansalvadorimonas verongulae]|uniref:pyridoxal phosphate-dependent aminotransferase n=1 Tax=Sansalvadorimonas verongulae TaxID=2172824 RepID=UPI0012BB4A7D|nr:aminotransferase class I/II-fold pyridoxal phosphate-dependent enzyme [Sansalvadorimonas verongulae]MTI12832.1 aminotransferase class I/II-fold pyridoxal phosphate-dependent enzyme [Sansalvadorimonas verongulae]
MITPEQLNNNIRGLKPSATLQINEDSNRLLRQGRDIIKLGLGQSPFPVPPPVVKALQNNAHEKDYLPVRGLDELRDIVATYYHKRDNIERQAEDILIGPGSKELLFNLQMACDGELLIPAPSWVSYAPQAIILGRKVTWLPTSAENNWRIEPDTLDQYCTYNPGRPRILILNYPSNPTGCSYSSESLSALSAVARKHGIIVVADEIYAETNYSGHHESIAMHYPEGTVISSGLSKWCGAGGWRLGVMVFPGSLRELQNTMAIIASETFTSISAPTQYAACTAFAPSKELDDYLNSSRQVLHTIATYTVNRLRGCDLSMCDPEGGFYILVNFEVWRDKLYANGITTPEQLCQRLLNHAGVALLPGTDFGLPADQLYIRLAFVDFDGEKALAAISAGEPRDDSFIHNHCPKIISACDRIERWLQAL